MDLHQQQLMDRCNNGAIIFLLLLLLNLLLGGQQGDGYLVPPTDEQRLVRYLTANYSRQGKPGATHSSALMVQARFFPVKLQNLLEKDETLQMTIRMQLNWKDPALQFDPLLFSNQTSVILPGGSIWIPDLQISNSMLDLYGILRDPRFDFKVYSDGTVWWHPTGNIATRCEIVLAYFPFDYQRCPIVMESGIYTHNQLNLTLRYDKTAWSKSMYESSGHWDLVSIKARSRLKYVTNSTAFTSVEFWIFLGRKSGYYKLNIIFPCGMLSALQMLTFFLPLESSERVPEATTILLSVIVFQSMIVQDLPRSSDALPLLCVYIDLLTGISVVSVGEAVLIAYFVSRKQERRFCPTWAVPLLKCLYRLRNRDPSVLESNASKSEDGIGMSRLDSHWRHHHGDAPYFHHYYSASHRVADRHLPCVAADSFYEQPHCDPYYYLHRRNCILCYEADCLRSGGGELTLESNNNCGFENVGYNLVSPNNNAESLKHRKSKPPSVETVGSNRPNGAIPDGRPYLINAYNEKQQETIDNSNQLSDSLKQIASRGGHHHGVSRIRQQLSNSKTRPVLLAPLARLDGASDCDSSDCELSETNFAVNANLSAPAITSTSGTTENDRQPSLLSPCSQSPPPSLATVECETNNKAKPFLLSPDKEKTTESFNVEPLIKANHLKKDDEKDGDTSPYSSFTMKRRQQRLNRDRRNVSRRNLRPVLLMDWIFLAKVVDYLAFVCCLFSITGVPIFLFGIIPPDSPDYNLDSTHY